jgi:hypothetical protein
LPQVYRVKWIAWDEVPLDPIVENLVEMSPDGQAFAPVFHTQGTYKLKIYSEAEGGANILTDEKSLELSCDETVVMPQLESDDEAFDNEVLSLF